MYDETSHNKGLKELLSSHTISELRELSLNTRDYNIQKMLSDCNTLEIRRNLAKNTNVKQPKRGKIFKQILDFFQ